MSKLTSCIVCGYELKLNKKGICTECIYEYKKMNKKYNKLHPSDDDDTDKYFAFRTGSHLKAVDPYELDKRELKIRQHGGNWRPAAIQLRKVLHQICAMEMYYGWISKKQNVKRIKKCSRKDTFTKLNPEREKEFLKIKYLDLKREEKLLTKQIQYTLGV